MGNNEKTLNKTENKHIQTKDGRPLGVQSFLLSYKWVRLSQSRGWSPPRILACEMPLMQLYIKKKTSIAAKHRFIWRSNKSPKQHVVGCVQCSCTFSDGVFFVSGTKHGAQFPCPRGYYNPDPRTHSLDSCLPCTPGNYCGVEGLGTVSGKCDPGEWNLK